MVVRWLTWLGAGAFISQLQMASCKKVERLDYYPDYSVYHTFATYQSDLFAIRDDPANQGIVRLEQSPGRTHMNQSLYLMKLTNFAKNFTLDASGAPVPKRKVFLTFGEHAREFVSVESFFQLVRNLTSGYQQPCSTYAGHYSRYVLDNLELHLIGLTNPDGKIFLESKNEWCHRNNGIGVDLNRNTDWQFNGPGSSLKPGDEEYNGGKEWSEYETRFVRDLGLSQNYFAYLSMHSGEQQVFCPFVDTESKRIKRRRKTTEKELALIQSVVQSSPWYRNGGIAYEFNSYSADGTLFDWFGARTEVDYSICAEIWGGPYNENCFVQFNPESKQLLQDLDSISTLYTTSFIHFVHELTALVYEAPAGTRLLDHLVDPGSATPARTRRHDLLDQLCALEATLERELD